MDHKSEPTVISDPEKSSPGSEVNVHGSVNDNNGVEQASIPRSITGIRWVLLLLAVLSSAFLFALDNSIVADIQPKIIERFGSIDKLPWLSVAFALGGSSTTLVWATFYSRFDAKYNYLTALFLFEVGSAICGSAPQIDVLIWGRCLAGLGGAGLYVGVLTLLSALTTPQERPMFIGSTGLIWGGGSVLGPVIGGAFADSSATWRWAFYINLVVAGVFLPVYLFIIPNVDPQPMRKISDRFRTLDYCGIFLILAILSLGTVGLAFGGSLVPWKSATVIAPLTVSGLLLIFFVFQQSYCILTTREDRILPIHYFTRRTLSLMFWVSFVSGGPIFIPIYFIPLFFQFTRGDSAIQAAVRLLPFIFLLVFFSLLSGGVMGANGLYMPWFIFGSVLIVIGSALMYTVDSTTSTSTVYGYSVILAIGAGSILQLGFIVGQAVVPRSEMSSAVAFINLAQIGGLDVSLTVANTVFLNVAIKQVAKVLPDADLDTIKGAISGTGTAFIRSLTPDVQTMVLKAVVYAISRTYIFCIAAGAVAILLTAGMKWEKVFLVL